MHQVKCWFLQITPCILYYTCFSQWQEYIKREISDCTPHISLFLSLRSTAAAMQMPGKCCAPHLLWFLWSLWATMEDNALSRSGARASNSLINSDHLKSINWETGIFWNRDLLNFAGDLWHRLLHSLLMVSKNRWNIASRTLSIAITALAIDRACPPSNCRTTFASLSPSALVYAIRLGVDTVTYTFMLHITVMYLFFNFVLAYSDTLSWWRGLGDVHCMCHYYYCLMFRSVCIYKPPLCVLDSGAGEATTSGDCGHLLPSVACES